MAPQRSRDTEEKILQAATQVFLERGKQGARMQEIANRAGINKALLHYYFRSKERLYNEVFQREASAFLNALLQAFRPQSTLQECLREFVHQYLTHLAQNAQLVRFFLWEIQSGSQNFSQLLQHMQQKHGFQEVPLLGLLRTAIASGEIRPLNPVQATLSLIGMCVYPFLAEPLVEQVFPGVAVRDKTFLAEREEEIFQLFWRGIQP